jgi:hypothetical protein
MDRIPLGEDALQLAAGYASIVMNGRIKTT